jgi:hypothetical protein
MVGNLFKTVVFFKSKSEKGAYERHFVPVDRILYFIRYDGEYNGKLGTYLEVYFDGHKPIRAWDESQRYGEEFHSFMHNTPNEDYDNDILLEFNFGYVDFIE